MTVKRDERGGDRRNRVFKQSVQDQVLTTAGGARPRPRAGHKSQALEAGRCTISRPKLLLFHHLPHHLDGGAEIIMISTEISIFTALLVVICATQMVSHQVDILSLLCPGVDEATGLATEKVKLSKECDSAGD